MKKHPYFGVNVVLENIHDIDLALQRIDELGCSWVRLTFNWPGPSWDTFYIDRYDQFVHGLKKRNVKILGTLAPNVPGTLRHMFIVPFTFNPNIHIKKFLEFTRMLATRYPFIVHWEVWNEPNNFRFFPPILGMYHKLLRKTRRALKKVNKHNVVVLGGLLGRNFDRSAYYLLDFIKREKVLSKVDVLSIHPYAVSCYILFNRPKTLLKKIIRKIDMFKKHYPDKPVWVTEIGIADNFPVVMRRKGISKIYRALLDYGTEHKIPMFLWVLNDFDNKYYFKYNPEKFFGLCTSKLKPKKTFKDLVSYVEKNKK